MLRNLYRRIQARLTKKYRVELIDDVTLSQSRQYMVKPITVIFFGGLLLTGIVLGTAALVIFTPIFHQLIPGYINPQEALQKEALMEEKIAQMDEETRRFEAYISSLKRVAGVAGDSLPIFSQASLDSLELTSQAELEALPANLQPNESSVARTNSTDESGSVQVIYLPEESYEAVRMSDNPLLLNLFPPLEGEVRNGFDLARQHYGVDIVAPEKTLIKSVAEGYVVMAEYSEDNGWVIGISSRENIVCFYKHNSRLIKEVGDYVVSGEPIAVIGNTGENSTGPHLHLEIWQQGTPLDPENYLRFNQ
jgi:murein DD-endopeptidase MepM/ murein hydrolase activator NlpD